MFQQDLVLQLNWYRRRNFTTDKFATSINSLARLSNKFDKIRRVVEISKSEFYELQEPADDIWRKIIKF